MRFLAILLVAGTLGGASPSLSMAAPLASEVSQLKQKVQELDFQLQDQREARTRQADAFNSSMTAITAASGLSVLLVTLGGLAASILGYRFIRVRANEHLTQRVDGVIKAHGQEIFEREARQLCVEYDVKLAELYAQMHGLATRE